MGKAHLCHADAVSTSAVGSRDWSLINEFEIILRRRNDR